MRFPIVLAPDEEGGGNTITVPSLPGCVTQGQTVEQAMQRARSAIAVYLRDETPESLATAGVQRDAIIAEIEIPA